MKAINFLFKTCKNSFFSMGVLLISISFLSAKKSIDNQPIFRGQIKLNNISNTPDTIIIQYIMPFSPFGTVTSKVYVCPDSSGNFGFKLPKISYPIKMIINVNHNGKISRINDGYLVEPSDKIDFIISEKNSERFAEFNGNGADKYELINRLDSLVKEFETERNKIELYDPNDYLNKLSRFEQLTFNYENKKKSLIKAHNIKVDIQRIIKYDYANFYSLWDTALWQYSTKNFNDKGDLKNLIKENFNKNKKQFSYNYDSLMVHCNNYIFRLALRESRDLVINDPENFVSLSTFYKNLQDKYFGMLRERLLANFFIGNAGLIKGFKLNQKQYDSLMVEAEKFITVPFVKKVYSDKLRLSKGKELLNSSFRSLNDKTVTTNSLKGKVLLIDIWALGCSWCAVFHKTFHEKIYPKLKADSNFVYLSINTDIKKERWETGIKSGLYTSLEYLNVYTDGLGTNHDFTKYYNIQSLPFLLLVDKNGKIYSNNIGEPEKAAQLINTLLKQ